jgi:hypothetical protein
MLFLEGRIITRVLNIEVGGELEGAMNDKKIVGSCVLTPFVKVSLVSAVPAFF